MIANGMSTPAQIRQALTNTALNIEAAGVDRDSGWGIVNALAAVGSIHTLTGSPGAHGWIWPASTSAMTATPARR